jgi:hypothetical protein
MWCWPSCCFDQGGGDGAAGNVFGDFGGDVAGVGEAGFGEDGADGVA